MILPSNSGHTASNDAGLPQGGDLWIYPYYIRQKDSWRRWVIHLLGTKLNRAAKWHRWKPWWRNQPLRGDDSTPVTLPAQALRPDSPCVQVDESSPYSRLVYVVSDAKAETRASLQKSLCTFLKPFFAGVCVALLVVSVTILGWQYLTQLSSVEQQLRALLTPLPDVLSAEQVAQLSKAPSLGNNAQEWITLSSQQVTQLTGLPPMFNLQPSAQLLQQLMVLFPDNS